MSPPQRDSLIRSVAEQVCSRRGFLADTYAGLLGIGLLSLLQRDLSADDSPAATAGPGASWQPGKGMSHFPAKAQRVLQVFCPGAAEKPTTVWDFYATALQILGFQHQKLTHYYNGLDRRLTDVQGNVIQEILA